MRAPRSWLWTYEARQLARYEDAVARRFSATILCTEAEARILRKRVPGSPVFAVNNFLDMSSYDPEATSVTAEVRALQPYVVFSGQMDYYPNVDAAEYFCREVFPAVRAQMPELKFVIVGRNPAPSVRRLAADPAIQVTGAVPDVRPYLRGAAAAVAPLRIARGVQNKVLEAMAMGVPVVTSGAVAAALPPDLAAHCGVEDDPRIMAVKLIRLLREQKTTPVASLRKAVIAHFGNPDLDLQLEAILQQAVRTGNAGRAAGAASVAGSASSVVAGEEKRPVPLSS
jgi:glycosyltransferase involved in cell wall biosynthesis